MTSLSATYRRYAKGGTRRSSLAGTVKGRTPFGSPTGKVVRSGCRDPEDTEIHRACKEYVIDIDLRAENQTKRPVRFLHLLLQCPNYLWDAAVKVIGNGNQIRAVE